MMIRFSSLDLNQFSRASLDTNPLHLSADYARTTPFGRPVVFGALGAYASLAHVTPPAGRVPASFTVACLRPLFCDIDYNLRLACTGDEQVTVDLLDGTTLLLRSTVVFRGGEASLSDMPETAVIPRTAARVLLATDLTSGFAGEGYWSPAKSAWLELSESWGVKRTTWGDAMLLALSAGSYVSGMELPGENALFIRYSAELPAGAPQLPALLHWKLKSHDARFGLVGVSFDAAFATGEMQTLLRSPRPPIGPAALEVPEAVAERWRGKRAVIIGASRGLGAALARLLVAAGATVSAVYNHSRTDIEKLAASISELPGRLIPLQGDASDAVWCRGLRDDLAQDSGLDLLICNAAPALHDLKIDAACYSRIRDYVHAGFALAAAPLAAMLDLLSAREGSVLIVSSIVAESPPAAWPHYVATKSAVEGLARVAALQYPRVSFCIARPAKIRTDLVNSPMAALNAEEPSTVALHLLAEAGAAIPGQVRFCH